MIKEYLKNNILLTDGAMGTYYSELTSNDSTYCEFANLNNKNIVRRIHEEYIKSGAKLIRTNTFSANTINLNVSREKLKDIIDSGCTIAKECADKNDVFIGASIGPIRYEENIETDKDIIDELKFICDCFFDNNINIFIFETLSSTKYISEISSYIRKKDNKSFILTQFAIKPDGYTRDGISFDTIFKTVSEIKNIDAYGLNCGSGPTHLLSILKKYDFKGKIVSLLPNAGYPEIIHERTVFPNTPEYFAMKMESAKKLGISIVGGCCGTNPSYIEHLNKKIGDFKKNDFTHSSYTDIQKAKVIKKENSFYKKLMNNEFPIAIELGSPLNPDVEKLMGNAKKLKQSNLVDLITIPDSPMAKMRANSCIIASKIQREIDIDVMPHICCRDKNINAIRSELLGGYIENIRNVLSITGDPISDASRVEVKKVFNLNSFKLIELINSMNNEMFKEDAIKVGGALNLNVKNKEAEYERMLKKIDKGCNFFLTQPIYDDEAIEFLKRIKEKTNVKILSGVMPLVTYKNAVFLNNELPGINIPENFIKRFSPSQSKEESESIGIEIATELGKKLKKISDGLYLVIPFNRVDMILKIIKNILEN
ncbi:bifunctional homocysteine S-methyltransferase/methylenetetrahydrofolate reductase [Clostridium sp. BJN0001]|uniref:bifunctional homocysteine S-methyltransferase/methylenetetrahydrofolate reductase n=1 Tax=Clostridium sp. BJN0001 TaxID=2930219 RepID=UPI001FD07D0A|nr:bifunctional homocysteine S-methyltransferase/methylenetetrahydrofolate reductase [Clostridium sp. BJN0001]